MGTDSRKRPLLGSEDDNVVREDTTVVLYAGHTNIKTVWARSGEIIGHRHGAYHGEDLVGKQFGGYVRPRAPHATKRKRNARGRREQETMQLGGAAAILPVTPELWAEAVDHRTQITFALDNNLVVSHLHLKPGSVVLESGTGSGSLTMFLARTVAPHGQVHTFEFNQARHAAAVEDFKRAGVSAVVSANHGDVCKNGFGEELNGKADAVFLDLPCPWLAIPHALKALKPFARICTFSPCIEQVQRSCELMAQLGFTMIRTVTATLREQRVFRVAGLLPPCVKRAAAAFPEPASSSAPDDASDEAPQQAESKPAESNGATSSETQPDVVPLDESGNPVFPPEFSFRLQDKFEQVSALTSAPFDRHSGHTGYLTFAYAPFSA